MASSRPLVVPQDRVEFPLIGNSDADRKYVVLFLPGNPCVIEYYHAFLAHLHDRLQVSSTASDPFSSMSMLESHSTSIQILGLSLAGFECGSDDDRSRSTGIHQPSITMPIDIDGQIRFVETMLKSYIEHHHRSQVIRQPNDYKLILIGHSFGAYLSLEIIRRFRASLSLSKEVCQERMCIVSAICLFPPVVHLAESPGGKAYGWLVNVPGLLGLICIATRLLSWLPLYMLYRALKAILQYPDDAIYTTCYLMRSRWGIRQSLVLMREEIIRLSTDTWDTEVWGAATPSLLSQPYTKLYFLFGENDNWFDCADRDRLIATRGRRGDSVDEGVKELWKPLMKIDRTGIPHDFSIRHSRPVADVVAGWLEEVLRQDI